MKINAKEKKDWRGVWIEAWSKLLIPVPCAQYTKYQLQSYHKRETVKLGSFKINKTSYSVRTFLEQLKEKP